ncbi:hypothetical protein [uncultured Thiodictyon sp.]|uniref:hypothetical protein n=1 Tax=uncultured Thiodictyon sp. TaxID=1846217 RepID=UPI0025D94906|nr:hypothetical protein [uncultured Thiodictyon sp.]
MPDVAEFDALTAEFYAVWLHYHPDLALQTGLPVTGRLLPPQGDDDLAALRGWLEELLLGLEALDFSALDADRQLDWELLAGAARVEHRELGEGDWRHLDPQRYLPAAVLAWLAWGPAEDLGDAWGDTLARLLRELPEHLRRAQARLRTAADCLAPPLLRVAAAEVQGMRSALRELARHPWWQRYAQGRPESDVLQAGADAALAGYRHCLTQDLAPRARGALGCGGAHLSARLRGLHFIDCELADGEGDSAAAPGYAAIVRALEHAELALADPPSRPEPVARPAQRFADGCGGRHHFAVTDPALAHRLPRRLANDASLAMGWHLYLGHRLAGVCPGARPGLAAERERLLLARLDLDLHTGRIACDGALARLRHHGLAGAAADARLAQLARHPGEALAGVLGWQLLEQAREHHAVGAGAGDAERDFHDRLVAQGAIPLPLVLRYGLGPNLWQEARIGVLGGC